jgi:hypothetical protein
MAPRVFIPAAAVLVFCLAGSARAEGPYYGGWGGGCWYPPSVAYSPERLPYFALYPPVYYSSQIVPRTYGQSPFAWPPVVPAPEEAAAPAAASPPSPPPLRIINPYVAQPNEVSKPAAARSPAHVPLVVYPAGAMQL